MKKLTCTNNKERYGAHHVAEPDHRVLGEKLKGQFKQVYNEPQQDKAMGLFLNLGF